MECCFFSLETNCSSTSIISTEKADTYGHVEVFVPTYGSPLLFAFFPSVKQETSSSLRRGDEKFWRFEEKGKEENCAGLQEAGNK